MLMLTGPFLTTADLCRCHDSDLLMLHAPANHHGGGGGRVRCGLKVPKIVTEDTTLAMFPAQGRQQSDPPAGGRVHV